MTEPFGQKIVDSFGTQYMLTEPFGQWPDGLTWME
jgi:hypothetical protein